MLLYLGKDKAFIESGRLPLACIPSIHFCLSPPSILIYILHRTVPVLHHGFLSLPCANSVLGWHCLNECPNSPYSEAQAACPVPRNLAGGRE